MRQRAYTYQLDKHQFSIVRKCAGVGVKQFELHTIVRYIRWSASRANVRIAVPSATTLTAVVIVFARGYMYKVARDSLLLLLQNII